MVVEERYVVVLQVREKDRELEFISAFITDEGYIKNEIKTKGGWAETKKSPSLNGD